jgi:hypothetical protein
MIIDYGKLKGKKVKLLCVFEGLSQTIYYDGIILDSSEVNKVVTISDRFSKTVHIDMDSIKQVVEL